MAVVGQTYLGGGSGARTNLSGFFPNCKTESGFLKNFAGPGGGRAPAG
jgi:hypothetical protein